MLRPLSHLIYHLMRFAMTLLIFDDTEDIKNITY